MGKGNSLVSSTANRQSSPTKTKPLSQGPSSRLVVKLLFLLLLAIFFLAMPVSADWANESFDRCMNITINNAGSETLTNFPAYINLTYDSDMQSNFIDIRFYDAACNNGGNLMDYEIENYTTSTNAHIWTRIPSLPSTGTVMSIYFKNNTAITSGENATGVWDNYYKAVWHMVQADANDSTSNNNNGTAKGGGVTATPNGKIDGADNFNGSSYVDVDKITFDYPISYECWFKVNSLTSPGDRQLCLGRFYAAYGLGLWNGAYYYGSVWNGTGGAGTFYISGIQANTWNYLALTYNGTQANFYINGQKQTPLPTTGSLVQTDNKWEIGANGNENYFLNGTADEIRISNTTRSANWINQTYLMINNQSSYVTIEYENEGYINISLSLNPNPVTISQNVSFYGHANQSNGTNVTSNTINIYINSTQYYYNSSSGLLEANPSLTQLTTDANGNYNYTWNTATAGGYSIKVNTSYDSMNAEANATLTVQDYINISLSLNPNPVTISQNVSFYGHANQSNGANIPNNSVSIYINNSLYYLNDNSSQLVNITPWWNPDYAYRTKINITSLVATSLNNTIVLVNLSTNDLISQSKMRSDCGDTRFADNNGIKLQFTMETSTCNTTNTIFWVWMNLTGNTNNTVWAYYGNSVAGLKTDYNNPDSSLVFYMHFDNSSAYGENRTKTFDFSKNGNNGTIAGNPNWSTTGGRFGGAYRFDAVDDYINTSFNIPNETGARTLTFWVKIKDKFNNDTARSIIRNSDHTGDSTDSGISIVYRSDEFEAYVINATGYRCTPIILENPTNDIWYHLALIHDNSNVYSYINGNLTTTTTCVGSKKNSHGLKFATFSTAHPERLFNGSIDEVRIYNRSLSIDEIRVHYNSTVNNYIQNQSLPRTDNNGDYNYTWSTNISGNYTIKVNATYNYMTAEATDNLTVNDEEDPTLLTACKELTLANTTYTLQNNVTSNGTCFTVLANNITIDGQGFTVNYSADGTVGYGVLVSYQNYTTIKNMFIREGVSTGSYNYGINLDMTYNSLVFNNSIRTRGTGSSAIYNRDGYYNNISSNTIDVTSTYSGIYNLYGGYSNIADNDITTTGAYGMYLRISHSIIRRNRISSSRSSGFFLTYSTNLTFIENNITTSAGNAFSFHFWATAQSSYNHVIGPDNLAEGKPVNYTHNAQDVVYDGVDFTQFGQVLFGWGENIVISNSNFSDDSLSAYGVDGLTVSNSRFVTNNSDGLDIQSLYSAVITGNNVTTNCTDCDAYDLTYLNSLVFANNTGTTMGSSSYALYMAAVDNGVFRNNNFTTYNTNGRGIHFQSSNDHHVFNNTRIYTEGVDAYGLYFTNSNDDVIFYGLNATTLGTSNPVYLSTPTHNLSLIDSILKGSTSNDFSLRGSEQGGVYNLTNVTEPAGSPVDIEWILTGAATLHHGWWLDVNVSSNNAALNGANVNITSSLGTIWPETTNSYGIIRKVLLGYTRNNTAGSNTTYYSNYTVNATKTGYSSNQTRVNMTTNRQVSLSLKGLPLSINLSISPNISNSSQPVNMSGYLNDSYGRRVQNYPFRMFINNTEYTYRSATGRLEPGTGYSRLTTDSNGYYSYTFLAPNSGGIHIIKVNATNIDYNAQANKTLTVEPYYVNVTISLNPSIVNISQNFTVYGHINDSKGSNITNNLINIYFNNTIQYLNPNTGILVPRTGTWWNTDWKHRTEINITSQVSSNINNAIVLVNLSTTSLISASRMRNDCGDTRFTDSNGNELQYTLETSTCNTTNTIYWVWANLTGNTDNTIYAYYGNSSATLKTGYSNPDTGLILYMHFDNSSAYGENSTYFYDFSKQGNNGTCTNCPTWNSTGRYGGAYKFNGTSNYIDLGSKTFPATFTITAWIKRSGGSGARTIFFGGADSPSSSRRDFFVRASNNLAWHHGTTIEFTDLAMPDNEWVHVAVTYDGTIRGYKDGVASSVTSTTALPAVEGVWQIGAIDTITEFFPGHIDEIRLWNRSLSTDEILAIYNSTANKYSQNDSLLTTDENGNYNYTIQAPRKPGEYEVKVNVSYNYNSGENTATLTVINPFAIYFEPPTDETGTITRNWSLVNVTVKSRYNTSAFIDWNRSLVGWWSFESYNSTGIYDNSTYNNFGTFQGGMTTSDITTGKFGNAIEFDGVDDWINIRDSSIFDFSDTDSEFSVSVWVNMNSITDWSGFVSKWLGTGENRGWLLGTNKSSTNIVLELSEDGTVSSMLSYVTTAQINFNEWTHVVATVDVGQDIYKIYINGQEAEGTFSGSSTIIDIYQNTANVNLGATKDGTDDLFNGSIDEVIIFNRILSPEEINASYNAGIYRLYSNFTNLTDGTYSFTAYAIDELGYINKTEERLIIVNTASSCIYSGLGDWIILCSENCNLTTNTDVKMNSIIFNGSGTVNITADITNWSIATAQSGCRVISMLGGGLKR